MKGLDAKFENFYNANVRLNEAVIKYAQTKDDLFRDGLIQRFEFTYELAWKTLKEYLEDIGIVDRNSPKAVVKEAFVQKLIADEETWLLMIKDRNHTAHVYNEKLAKEIAERITALYVKEFDKLIRTFGYHTSSRTQGQ